MLLGQRLGVRADVLADVIGSATGACWSCNTNNPVPGALPDRSPPSERDYDGGFATALMLKVRTLFGTVECDDIRTYGEHKTCACVCVHFFLQDMGLASESAAAAGVALPTGAEAQRVYAEVIERTPELARKDFSSVYLHLEKLGRAKANGGEA